MDTTELLQRRGKLAMKMRKKNIRMRACYGVFRGVYLSLSLSCGVRVRTSLSHSLDGGSRECTWWHVRSFPQRSVLFYHVAPVIRPSLSFSPLRFLCSSIYFWPFDPPRKPFCVAQTMVPSLQRVFKMLYVMHQSARLAIRAFITLSDCWHQWSDSTCEVGM